MIRPKIPCSANNLDISVCGEISLKPFPRKNLDAPIPVPKIKFLYHKFKSSLKRSYLPVVIVLIVLIWAPDKVAAVSPAYLLVILPSEIFWIKRRLQVL